MLNISSTGFFIFALRALTRHVGRRVLVGVVCAASLGRSWLVLAAPRVVHMIAFSLKKRRRRGAFDIGLSRRQTAEGEGLADALANDEVVARRHTGIGLHCPQLTGSMILRIVINNILII